MPGDFSKAGFVDDQQVGMFNGRQDAQVGSIGPGTVDFFDQGVGMSEEDLSSLSERCQADGIGQVSFSYSALSQDPG